MDRISIGIDDLDKVLGGGIPQGSIVLLAGNAGSGKTILSTQFLLNGASKQNEKGVYVSFSETKDDYYRNMNTLGIDMKSLEEKGLFKFMDFATMDEESMRKSVEIMMDSVIEFGAKRLVLDSISAFANILGKADTRILLHSIFGRLIKSIGITAIVIGEIPYSEKRTGLGIEEFVADVVILLRYNRDSNIMRREIEITKVRGSAISGPPVFEYLIDKKYKGIGVILLPQKSRMEVSFTEKLSTGIKGVDRMLDGGIYKGSITLIEGAAGIGKTTATLQFLTKNAQKGEKALFISLEEPVGQIRQLMQHLHLDYKKLSPNLRIESFVPEAMSPLLYYKMIRDLIEFTQTTILAIDTITTMQNSLPANAFVQLMRYLQLLCKEKNLTVLLTAGLGTFESTSEAGVSTLADNIIRMRYHEEKFRMAREIMVIKSRGSAHDHFVRTFEITKRGVVVYTGAS